MLITLKPFSGALPRLNPRLLPEVNAQIARNVRLKSGALSPIRMPKAEHTFGADVGTIFRDGSTWYGWASPGVSVARAPVAQDRLYFTGDGVPKMKVAGVDYDLALAPPAAAPMLTALSTVDPALSETILYAYTFVTSFGEESRPSPLSAPLDWSEGVDVRLTGFSAAPGGRGITSMRIYRSQTTTSGITDLFFVDEVPVATVTYDHDLTAKPIQNPILTTDFDTPPDTLQGLVSLPNGMMAAFDGRDVYFCEPYQPHAWPEKYVLTVDHAIVGLAGFGSVLAILTSGTPYIAQGTHPETMAMEKMERTLPCLSRRGIVDMGYAAFYPSSDGVVQITPGGADVITKSLFTRDDWLALSPDSMIAESYDGRYLFTYTYTDFQTYDAGTYSDAFADVLDGVDVSAPPGGTLPIFDGGRHDTAYGLQRLGSIDAAGDTPFFSDFDVALPQAMHRDDGIGNLHVLQNDRDVSMWDGDGAGLAVSQWRSKVFMTPAPTNFGAILIQCDAPPDVSDTFEVRIFADGMERAMKMKADYIDRLPSGFQARRWEIEIRSTVPVTAVYMANTVDELEMAL